MSPTKPRDFRKVAREVVAGEQGRGVTAGHDALPVTPAAQDMQPAAARRPKRIRLSVDLDPPQHRALRIFALDSGNADVTDIIRILIDQLLSDQGLAEDVRAQLDRRRQGSAG